jgi:hypothetical protein
MSINELGSRSVYAGLWFSARQVTFDKQRYVVETSSSECLCFIVMAAASHAKAPEATLHAACCDLLDLVSLTGQPSHGWKVGFRLCYSSFIHHQPRAMLPETAESQPAASSTPSACQAQWAMARAVQLQHP